MDFSCLTSVGVKDTTLTAFLRELKDNNTVLVAQHGEYWSLPTLSLPSSHFSSLL